MSKGCDVHPTTISSGRSCPSISLDPNDDQGEDGNPDKANLGNGAGGDGKDGPKITGGSKGGDDDDKPKPKETGKPPTPKETGGPAPDGGKDHPSIDLWGFPWGLLIPGKKPKKAKPDVVAFQIGYFRFCPNPKDCKTAPTIWDYSAYYPKDPRNDFDPCKIKATYQTDKKHHDPHDPPKFPIKMGPFDAEGRKECKYTRENDADKGKMECKGEIGFKCRVNPGVNPLHDCKDLGKGVSWLA